MDDSFFEELRRKRVPFGGSLEVTYRCNLYCAHCYQFAPRGCNPGCGQGGECNGAGADAGAGESAGEMTLDDYVTLLDELKDAGCLFLSITGGEPLLRTDIMDILRAVDERRFSFALQTNALLLDEAAADQLSGIANMRVEISLHSASAEKHDAFTGVPGSYQACLDAMDLLRESNIPVMTKSVVTALNVDELDRMVDLAERHGALAFFSPVIFPRNDRGTGPLRFRMSDDQLMRFIAFQKRYDAETIRAVRVGEGREDGQEDAREKSRGDAAPGPGLPPGCGEPAAREVAVAPEAEEGTGSPEYPGVKIRACGAGLTTFCVNPYGDIYPCIAWPQVVGNVLEEGFPEAWRGSGIIEEIRLGEFNICRECAECPILEKCPLCPALSFVEEGDARARSQERCRQTKAWLEGMEFDDD